MLFFAILLQVVYGVMGLLMGAFSAWVYNFVARRIGDIRLELRADA